MLVPIKTAINENGERLALINGEWVDVTAGHPALEAGPGDAFAAAAGRQFKRFGQGIGNLGDLVSGDFAGIELRRQDVEREDELFNPLQQQRPVATTAGTVAPFLATAGGAGALGATSLGSQALVGGALGLTDFREQPGQQLLNAPLGAAIDAAGSAAVGRTAQALSRRGAMAERVAQRIDEAGAAQRQATAAAATPAATGPKVAEVADDFIDAPGATRLEGVDPGEALAAGFKPIQGGGDDFNTVSLFSGPERNRVIQAGQRLGMEFSVGDISGNPARRSAENAFSSAGFLGTTEQAAFAQNKRIGEVYLNRVLGNGHDLPQFSQAEIGQAHDAVTAQFQQIADALPDINLTRSFRPTIDRAVKGQLESISQLDTGFKNDLDPFLKNLSKLVDDAGGQVPGNQAMRFRSDLVDLVQQSSELGSNKLKGGVPFLNELIDSLDREIATAAKGTGLSDAYKQARIRWRVLKTVENSRAVDKGGEGVNPRSLANALSKEFKTEFNRNGLTLDNVAPNASEEVKNLAAVMDWARAMTATKQVIGDSGTATRMLVNQAIQDPLGAIRNQALNATIGRGSRALLDRIPDSLIDRVAPQVPDVNTILGTNGGFP